MPSTIDNQNASNDFMESYLECDASVRSDMFLDYLGAVKSIASSGSQEKAARWAARAVSLDLDYSSLMALERVIRHAFDGRRTFRLAVLGGPTTIQLVQLLRTFLDAQGIYADIYESEYGLFRQEILNEKSGLYKFQPQIVFLATSAKDISTRPSLDLDDMGVERLLNEELASWQNLWDRIRERLGASVIQNLFEIAPWGAMGHYGVRHRSSFENFLWQLNSEFARNAPTHVTLHDLPSLVCQVGANNWFDARYYLEAKMPCGPENLVPYAHSVASLVQATVGKSRKVLVLDLDNTLWGGVIGDVGVQGVEVGQGSGEGEAFVQFQQFAKQLHERGVLLAVCSKNYPEVARQPFEQRADDMVLKLQDFSCFVANWNNKADNLRAIARTLDVGIDSLVFVDDNPAERALVRRFLPEVAVPDLPDDPAGYSDAVIRHHYFETISFTNEDIQRSRYYQENLRRKELASQTQDLDAFLASLNMRAKVEPVRQANITRVTQLVNKSNQFNLTTRRRTLSEIEELSDHPDWITLTISLNDKLGDNGLISVLFLRKQQQEAALSIDTWLMSCRVLQRGVEQFALGMLVEYAKEKGCRKLYGKYIPTKKNELVKDHYPQLGFRQAGQDDEGIRWVLDLAELPKLVETHIELEA